MSRKQIAFAFLFIILFIAGCATTNKTAGKAEGSVYYCEQCDLYFAVRISAPAPFADWEFLTGPCPLCDGNIVLVKEVPKNRHVIDLERRDGYDDFWLCGTSITFRDWKEQKENK